ncbi:MAG: flagellar protein FliO/FliZ [Bacillota bacterium]|nr:flagellar protein FliO/FliZ [Bacillota bacterium]MDK2855167.1 flagellar protein FliO/FliZ [Bacillota bacterium]
MPGTLGRTLALILVLTMIWASGNVALAVSPPAASDKAAAAPTPDNPGYLAAQPEDGPPAFNPTVLVLRMLAGLVLVLLLLYLATRFITQRLGLPRGAGRHLAVLDTLPLGPGKGILLVRAGKRQLLIGVSGDRIALLGELNEGDLASSQEVVDFQAALSQAAQKGLRLMPESLWREAAAAIRQQVGRLHGHRQDSGGESL